MNIENKLKPTRMDPGSDLHLTMLMAKYHLNHVTGEDRQALLAWGRDVWQAAKEQAVPCVWTEDEYGSYETRCGNLFEVTDGTPEENNMRFCPYCGGELAASLGAK